MEKLSSIVSRILFIGAFVLVGLAALEKLANIFGFKLLWVYTPWHILEFSVIALLFVIALQLREIKSSSKKV